MSILEIDIDDFKQALKDKVVNDYEGTWASNNYKIGVKKIKNHYIGFIIEADGVYWKKGQVKFKIDLDNNTAIYYSKKHKLKKIENVNLFDNHYIGLGTHMILRKDDENYIENPKVEQFFKSMKSHSPELIEIGENTLLFRIPHMWYQFKKDIDSIVSNNMDVLLATKSLIIDIRNNGGGSDFIIYQGLLPIIYTNPIRNISAELLSTELNNKMLSTVVEDATFDKNIKEWASQILERARNNRNHFVNMDDSIVSITKFDTIYAYPKNVAILIDENVGSAAEQFLLDTRQSKKVKLFGVTTAGGLDLANVNETTSPCKEYVLSYALSRSMRIPDMAIDEKGVQPDYYIDKTIPKYKWVEFVIKILIEE